jgi:dimethylhistidine N-methyltransferase
MAAHDGLALVELDEDGVAKAFRADVLAGLAQPQKAIPARWLYDDAGSELFEAITRLPEYYPTRAETEILSERGAEFRELIGPGRAVVEFGSGSSVKTPLLIDAIEPAAYVPLDISGDFLRAAAADLAGRFPGLPVHPVEADFTRRVILPGEVAEIPKLGFFPGSTIGNMVARTGVDLLRSMRETLGADSMLLIGMDLLKDAGVLAAAYDDAQAMSTSRRSWSPGLTGRRNLMLSSDMK